MATVEDGEAVQETPPEPLRPYDEIDRHEPVLLYVGSVTAQLADGSSKTDASARILLSWLPLPHVLVQMVVDDAPRTWMDGRVTLLIPMSVRPGRERGIEVSASTLRVSWGSRAEMDFQVLDPLISSVSGLEHAAWVEAHVVNCQRFFGGRVTEQLWGGSRTTSSARLVVQNHAWRATLDESPDIDVRLHEARAQSGYAVTHSVRLEGIGRHLDPDGAAQAARELAGVLSLASGHSVGTTLMTGYDSADRQLWTVWDPPAVDPLVVSFNVLPRGVVMGDDDQMGDPGLSELSAAYLRRGEENTLVLQRATAWYLQAQRADSDSAMLLIGAGLEVLTYWYLVMTQGVSTQGFDKIPSVDRLRLLLAACGTPFDLPAPLVGLAGLQRANGRNPKENDGPWCVTEFRNGVAHPPTRARRQHVDDEALLREAEILGLWYLDLAVLKFLSYSGAYIERVSQAPGAQLVPWVAKTSMNRIRASL